MYGARPPTRPHRMVTMKNARTAIFFNFSLFFFSLSLLTSLCVAFSHAIIDFPFSAQRFRGIDWLCLDLKKFLFLQKIKRNGNF